MTNDFAIDMGAPRSVAGHVVSGALAGAMVAGALNYNRYLKGEISQKEALSSSLKLTAQGGIATGSAIAAANHLGSGNILGMLTAVSIGAMSVYAVEKISDNVEDTIQIENNGE